ncbi:MAG: NERD domain-containing protein [Chloroflexi bacterium]|nr:NERD domain-containing protein [Chloroflexota bacterium]
MRIIRNERRIRVSSKISQYAVLGGLLALVAGLVISFVKPYWLTLMVVCLALGFSLSILGGFFSDRFVGPLAHHKALVGALKGTDKHHMLLQYVLPAPHVLLEPGNLTVFLIKTQGGQVTYQEQGRWKHQQRGKFFRQFAGQEAVGAPDFEAERNVRKMERWLAQNLPDVEIPIRAVIVFVNPDITLDATGSGVPTLYSKKLKAWLRGPGKLAPLPTDVHHQLAQALDTAAKDK